MEGAILTRYFPRDFAAGFIRSKPLFDFIDVGPGKERTDHKIRGKHYLHITSTALKKVIRDLHSIRQKHPL